MELVRKRLKIWIGVMVSSSENDKGNRFHALWGGTTGCKGLNVGSLGRSGKFWIGFWSVFLHRLAKWPAVINPAGSIYVSSEELWLSSRLSIAGGASEVSEDTSGTMTGRCCTTVGGGGGWEEVRVGPEWVSMMRRLALCFLTLFGEDDGDESISGGG